MKEQLKVNSTLIQKNIEELGMIGRDAKGCLNRLAYSPSFWQGVDWLKRLMEESGLQTEIDGVGNVIGTIPGENSGGSIILGSHIDTVLNAGIFDGTVGVLGALEAIRTLKKNGVRLKHTVRVIAFAEEEGLVISGLFGSRSYIGKISEDSQDVRIASEIGISREAIRDAAVDPAKILGYVELHVEQGGVLETLEKEIGIVTAIVGYERFTVTVFGKENHAGTTPMKYRDDALVKAARMLLDLQKKAQEIDEEMVCTVGVIRAFPGACNTVPGKVEMQVDMRAVEQSSIDRLREYMYAYYSQENAQITIELSEPPVRMEPEIQRKIEEACQRQGYSYHFMASGAAHDTTAMGLVTGCGMIFIPSIGGISHSPLERSTYSAVEKGAQILMETLLLLDAAWQ